jgi:hypothetical protein
MKTEHWISVKERLPENNVIVHAKLGRRRIVDGLKRNGNLWFLPDGSMYVYYQAYTLETPRKMKLSLSIIVGLLLLASCSPESKLRRAKRLITQAEAAGLEWKSDTIFQEVKIVVPQTKFDTVVRQVDFRDTIVVTKDKVVTRVKVNTVEKEIFVETKCPEKVVVKKVPYSVEREIRVGDSFWTNFKQALFWLLVGGATVWVLKLFKVIP